MNKFICPIPSVNFTGNEIKASPIRNRFNLEKIGILNIFVSNISEKIKAAIELAVYIYETILIGSIEIGINNINSVGG